MLARFGAKQHADNLTGTVSQCFYIYSLRKKAKSKGGSCGGPEQRRGAVVFWLTVSPLQWLSDRTGLLKVRERRAGPPFLVL
jgi:hypothetical protein